MSQFSFRLPNADYLGFPATTQAIVETACKAEELGFDALFVNDHVIVDDSPRNELWRNVYDPLVVLSYVAARTSRIKLGTSVLIMPYRNPIVTAKTLATLDQMSGGRVIAGVGSGWNQAEFDALGRALPSARQPDRRIPSDLAGMLGAGDHDFPGQVLLVRENAHQPKAATESTSAHLDRRLGSRLPAPRRPLRGGLAAHTLGFAGPDQQPEVPGGRLIPTAERATSHQDELPSQLQPHHGQLQQRRPAHRPGLSGAGAIRHEALPTGSRARGVPDKLQWLRQPAATAGLHGRAGGGGHSQGR